MHGADAAGFPLLQQVSVKALDEVKHLKGNISSLMGRVQTVSALLRGTDHLTSPKCFVSRVAPFRPLTVRIRPQVRDEIQRFLDDDSDMRDMYLTRKAKARAAATSAWLEMRCGHTAPVPLPEPAVPSLLSAEPLATLALLMAPCAITSWLFDWRAMKRLEPSLSACLCRANQGAGAEGGVLSSQAPAGAVGMTPRAFTAGRDAFGKLLSADERGDEDEDADIQGADTPPFCCWILIVQCPLLPFIFSAPV